MIHDTLIVQRVIDKIKKEETIPHRHPQGQLVLVKQGVLHGYTNNQRWLVKSGMAIWIPPNILHYGIAHNCVNLNVLYIPSQICKHLNVTSDVKLIDFSSFIVALCDRLADTEAPLTEESRKSIVKLLFDEIARKPASSFTLLLPQDSRLKKVTDSLITNPAQRYSLAEWGKYVGATARTLSRLFRKETGLCYKEWHDRLLLSAAWQELAKGASNEKLSMILGFSSGDSFGHWFRRVSGNCPSDIRKYIDNYGTDDPI